MKKYTYTISESLEYTPVNDTMCAYRFFSKTLGTGGKLISTFEYQGITFKKIINKKKSKPGNIDGAEYYGFPYGNDKQPISLGCYDMFKPGLAEIVRNHIYGSDQIYSSIRELRIQKPYDFLDSKEEFEILCYSGYDGHLYDVNGNVLPRAISFSNGMNAFSEDYYNITQAVKLLKKRKDVVFSDDNYDISFKWIPSNSQWDEVKRFKHHSLYMQTYIMLNIFGINPKNDNVRKDMEKWFIK